MKKALLMLATMCTMGAVMAQTPEIVSTTPSNRNAVIEEYTGVNCTYCPDGHKHVNQLIADNPGRVTAINVHTGYYAVMYTTQWGSSLMAQTGLTGFPAATVNRHVFQGNAMASSDRSVWGNWTQNILNEASPANIASKAVVDPKTRTISIDVEIYYTDDQDVSSNMLNVVLLQDNVLGPQVGAANFYPENMVGDLYRHNHMLRDMLTGQWGETITELDKGTLVQKHYDYTIPTIIGDVPINDFADLQVAAFLAEDHTEIITGAYSEMEVLPAIYMSNFDYEQTADCALDYQPFVTIKNTTEYDMTSVVLKYDGTEYTIDKTISAGTQDTIQLPLYTIEIGEGASQNALTTKKVSLVSYVASDSEESVEINSPEMTITFADFMIYNVTGPLTLRYGYDYYGSECQIQFIDQSTCKEVWTEGPWKDIDWFKGQIQYIYQIPNATYNVTTFSPENAGLYILRILDGYGDGWSFTNDDTVSGLWLTDANGKVFDEPWGYSNAREFKVYDIYLNVLNAGDGSQTTGINDVKEVNFSVYPNPVHGQLSISSAEPVRMVEVIDVNGRIVATYGANTTSVDTRNYNSGVYVVRVTTDNGVGMQKVVVE